MGFNEAPYVANAAHNIATRVANALHFGSCGDLTTSSRYTAAEICKRNSVYEESS